VSGIAAVANLAYLAAAAPARARLERAMRDPGRVQREKLARLLRANAGSAFGRAHQFARIATMADYQARVPIRDYDAFAADVERVAAGERGVLTAEAVAFVEPSGGSSGASKLVPYTASLLAEFSAATMPWIFDLLRHRPALRTGRAYWAITPPAPRPPTPPGGVPVGLEHDSDYFPAFARALLEQALGVPRIVSRTPDVSTCRYVTLLALLALPDLALVSVWSPSFLTRLADVLDEHFAALVDDLERGGVRLPLPAALSAALAHAIPARPRRAAWLRRRFGRRAPEDLGVLWDRLALVSCWTDGHASRALHGMRGRFPRVEVQGKGLLATEGVVSIPLFAAPAPVAAVTAHVLEFLPEGQAADGAAPARTVEELDAGATYEVLLTTAGGLYRYRLHDLVRVEGHLHRAPLLRFVGRADRASDLAGEKLTPAFAERALAAAARSSGVRPAFAMLAPHDGERPHYRLYVDAPPADAARLAERAEAALAASYHYALCRSLGQLGPVAAVAVRDAERVYERACLTRGQRGGAIKPVSLDARLDWAQVFAGAGHDASGAPPAALGQGRPPVAIP